MIRVRFANEHCIDGFLLDLFHQINLLFEWRSFVFSKISNTSVSSASSTSISGHLSSLCLFLKFFLISLIFDFSMSFLELSDDFLFLWHVAFHPRMSKNLRERRSVRSIKLKHTLDEILKVIREVFILSWLILAVSLPEKISSVGSKHFVERIILLVSLVEWWMLSH